MSSRLEIKSELIVTGYIRSQGKGHQLFIPHELFTVVLLFYPKIYHVYALGKDDCYQFALKEEFQDRGEEYNPSKVKTKWFYLTEISKLCENPSFINCYNSNVMIQTTDNKIYAIGANDNGALGIGDNECNIVDTLTKVKSDAMDRFKIDIVSTGQFTNHSFIVLKDDQDKQIFYSFGDNSDQQQGHKAKDNYIYSPLLISFDGLFKDIKVVQISTGILYPFQFIH